MDRIVLAVLLVMVVTLGCASVPTQDDDERRSLVEAEEGVVVDEVRVEEGPAEGLVIEGTVEVPGMSLGFVACIEDEATLSIPAQNAFDVPLTEVERDDAAGTVVFVLPVPGAPARFELVLEGDAVSGTMSQHGVAFPVVGRRHGAGDSDPLAAARPQTPRPPFPYRVEEVRFANAEAGIELAGTLTLPEGSGPWPAVVLVTGSGPQDRDQTILGHKPFWVLADHLTRHGVAVLRYDDRGVAQSGGDFASATSLDFADDALAAVEALRARSEIDAARVGIVGHSEGAVVAPLAAVRAPDAVAFLVLLAPSGMTGLEVLVAQYVDDVQADGGEVPAELLARVSADHRRLLEALVAAGGDVEREAQTLQPLLQALVEGQLEVARARGQDVSGQDAAALAEQGLAGLGSPWMQTFLVLDPTESLGRIACPVLALWGSLDTQIAPARHRAAVEAALAAAPSDDVTLDTLEGLNHLFQRAVTGSVQEYAALPETFSPVALDALTTWIASRVQRTGDVPPRASEDET